MTTTLIASPSTPAPSTSFTVTGTGFADARSRWLLDGVVQGATVCSPTTPLTKTFTAPSSAGSAEVTFEAYVGGTWVEDGSVTVTVTAVTPPTSSGQYPSDRNYQFLSKTIPTVPAMPGYLTPWTDPLTGIQITRVTNVHRRGHFYSRYAWLSSDGEVIYLGASGSDRTIDGNDYTDIGAFSGLSNAVLCNTSRRIYGVNGGGAATLLTQTFSAAGALLGTTTKHTFTGYQVWIGGDSGSWEGGISDNDQFICLTLIDVGAGGGDRLIVYDTVNDTIVGNRALPSGMDNAQISHSGAYVVVVGGGETRVWPRALTGSGLQIFESANHGDNAINAAGEDIFVTNNSVDDTGPTALGVQSARLSDGLVTTLLPPGTAFEYGHTSGRNWKRPGWVYLSVYNSSSTTSGRYGRGRVIALKTDGSFTVNDFGYSYAFYDGDPLYYPAPHASPSPDGTRVIIHSGWGTNAGANIFDYILEMP